MVSFSIDLSITFKNQGVLPKFEINKLELGLFANQSINQQMTFVYFCQTHFNSTSDPEVVTISFADLNIPAACPRLV